ncbi:MAG: TetR/AcrR family transcriptional regulator [Actinomycetota bacterium]
MVQKATDTPSGRGRPPKFDHDAVVTAAIDAFWERGLEATSLTDIEAATGVDRSTLYNSFGGKSGLYELATDQYLQQAETWLFEPLLEGDGDGLDDILRFLDRLKTGLTTASKPGCLIVNDMAIGPDKRPSERYQAVLERGLREALGRAESVPAPLADGRARLIASSVIGANLISRAGRSTEDLGLLIDAVIEQVESWR